VTHDEILQKIREVLAHQFGVVPAAITRETVALDVDGWDSVSHVHVMLEIERRFGLQLPEERIFDLDNVGALVDLVADLAAKA